MKKFTKAEMSEHTLKCAQNYLKGRKLMQQFQNGCTSDTFIFLFEESEGKRLWRHYVVTCRRDIDKFLTYYLNEEQQNELWIQLFSYTNLAKGII